MRKTVIFCTIPPYSQGIIPDVPKYNTIKSLNEKCSLLQWEWSSPPGRKEGGWWLVGKTGGFWTWSWPGFQSFSQIPATGCWLSNASISTQMAGVTKPVRVGCVWEALGGETPLISTLNIASSKGWFVILFLDFLFFPLCPLLWISSGAGQNLN